jgi:NADPH:quinone reductase
MLAIRQHAFGPPENLLYEEVPDPVPGEGQVRIAVEAAGVHLIDTTIRSGGASGAYALPVLPMTPGREVAGRVDAVGPGVEEAWIGRRVVAHLGMASGGYAEMAVSAVEALHEVPDHLTADAAVTMIGTGRTAVGVLDVAAVAPDDVVLVTAAAGGLGTLFVQAARNVDATVVGVAGGREKVERAAAAGATAAIDYLDPAWPDRVREVLGDAEVSLVLDGVGGGQGRAALELLGVGGRLVMFGSSSGEPTEFTAQEVVARGLTVSWALGYLRRLGSFRDLETRALADAASGRLVPLVGQRFPLAEAATAHKAIESRATVGKSVLVP